MVSPQMEAKLIKTSITVRGITIQLARQVHNLGAIFDKHLSMKAHVSHLCKLPAFICRVYKYLTEESAKCLMHAIVTSWIDGGNMLLYGLPNSCLDWLQKVLSTAACIVRLNPRTEPISPRLQHLHWLWMREITLFELLFLTYKLFMALTHHTSVQAYANSSLCKWALSHCTYCQATAKYCHCH